MAEFKKKDKNKFWYSPLFLTVLLILVGFLIYSIIGLIEKERETSRKKELVLSKIESLQDREKKLNQDITKLQTEEGIEETIREKYQVVKDGEKMVVIIEDEEVISSDNDSFSNYNFWKWLKRLFIN